MIREDAYYFKILLMSGLRNGYDEWLDGYLTTEDPLSDIVLELSLCGTDVEKTIRCLHNYCKECDFDEKKVVEKLHLFLKDAYNKGRFSKEEVVSYMYIFAKAHEDTGVFASSIWEDMYYMDDYLYCVYDGSCSWESFDKVFLSYLNDGVPLNSPLYNAKADDCYPHKEKGMKSFFEKIRKFFSKK